MCFLLCFELFCRYCTKIVFVYWMMYWMIIRTIESIQGRCVVYFRCHSIIKIVWSEFCFNIECKANRISQGITYSDLPLRTQPSVLPVPLSFFFLDILLFVYSSRILNWVGYVVLVICVLVLSFLFAFVFVPLRAAWIAASDDFFISNKSTHILNILCVIKIHDCIIHLLWYWSWESILLFWLPTFGLLE